jgi:hypothetical protein
LRNNPEPVDQSEHWVSQKTMGRLATVGWDVGVVLTVVSIFLLIARLWGTASASNGVGEDVRQVGSFGLSSRRSRRLSGARSAPKPLCKHSESLKGNCDMGAQTFGPKMPASPAERPNARSGWPKGAKVAAQDHLTLPVPMADQLGESIGCDGKGAGADSDMCIADADDVKKERHGENRTAAANQSERESDSPARKHGQGILSPR